jgi:hypothetical protein
MIAHIVLFQPREDSTREQQASLVEAISVACREIPSVMRAQVGKRILIGAGYEDKIGLTTYSHVAILEFEGREQLVEYLEHPLHKQLGRLFWQVCGSTLIEDLEIAPANSVSINKLLA